MFPPGRLLFPFEFELLTPLTCACPRLTFPGKAAVRIFHRRLHDQRGPGTSSDATAATHNEMGLPVDVLSEKREMQV